MAEIKYYKIPIEKRKRGRAYRRRPSEGWVTYCFYYNDRPVEKGFKVMEWVKYGKIRKLSNYLDGPFSITF